MASKFKLLGEDKLRSSQPDDHVRFVSAFFFVDLSQIFLAGSDDIAAIIPSLAHCPISFAMAARALNAALPLSSTFRSTALGWYPRLLCVFL